MGGLSRESVVVVAEEERQGSQQISRLAVRKPWILLAPIPKLSKFTMETSPKLSCLIATGSDRKRQAQQQSIPSSDQWPTSPFERNVRIRGVIAKLDPTCLFRLNLCTPFGAISSRFGTSVVLAAHTAV